MGKGAQSPCSNSLKLTTCVHHDSEWDLYIIYHETKSNAIPCMQPQNVPVHIIILYSIIMKADRSRKLHVAIDASAIK